MYENEQDLIILAEGEGDERQEMKRLEEMVSAALDQFGFSLARTRGKAIAARMRSGIEEVWANGVPTFVAGWSLLGGCGSAGFADVVAQRLEEGHAEQDEAGDGQKLRQRPGQPGVLQYQEDDQGQDQQSGDDQNAVAG